MYAALPLLLAGAASAADTCLPGQVPVETACCWPGQTWDGAACRGVPRCPEGAVPDGERCRATRVIVGVAEARSGTAVVAAAEPVATSLVTAPSAGEVRLRVPAGARTVVLGDPVVLGPREDAEILGTLAALAPRLAGCVPGTGTVNLRYSVGADGRVAWADPRSWTWATPEPARCVADAVRSAGHPAAGAPVVVGVQVGVEAPR